MNTLTQSEPHSQADSGKTWKLTLAYDGTDYSGWQVQPGLRTVQGELQAALGRVTGESPLPQGSGRTDAGVHALAQVASFGLQARIPADNLCRALNRTLPAAIRVIDAKTVADSFHARHSTLAKTYEYRVFLEHPRQDEEIPERGTLCPPFLARYVYAYPWPMELETLQAAAQAFIGTRDFLSFAATDPDLTNRKPEGEAADARTFDAFKGVSFNQYTSQSEPPRALTPEGPNSLTAIRTIFSSAWHQLQIDEGILFVYRVRGSGFLHHMVRNLVGTMLDVGRGYRSASDVPEMIAARARAAAGPTAPARGLFLHSVEYDSEPDVRSTPPSARPGGSETRPTTPLLP